MPAVSNSDKASGGGPPHDCFDEKERERHFRKIYHGEGRLLMLYPYYVLLSHIQKFVKLSDVYRNFNTAFLNFGD